jgi:AcrR family transcriptional regulator
VGEQGADDGNETEQSSAVVQTGRRKSYRKSAVTRRAIVQGAAEVFATYGYQVGTYQDIADRIGMSQSSLFHHFPTKRDLLLAVLEYRDLLSDTAADGTRSPGNVRGVLEQARRNAQIPGLVELYTVLAGESVTQGHPARGYFVARFERLRRDFAADLRTLAAEGLVREGVDPDRAAASLIALWDGIQLQGLLEPDLDVVSCLRDYIEGLLAPGVAPHAGP